jgi:Domain of unknown function (DUF397)
MPVAGVPVGRRHGGVWKQAREDPAGAESQPGRADTGGPMSRPWVPSSLVRHSKFPQLGHLPFTRDEWDAFLLGVKAGEFDDLEEARDQQ